MMVTDDGRQIPFSASLFLAKEGYKWRVRETKIANYYS